VPPSGEPKEKVVAEFLSIHDQLLSLVHKANGLDLARIIVPDPIPILKFSLGSESHCWRRMIEGICGRLGR
jgi:hypothetical protein